MLPSLQQVSRQVDLKLTHFHLVSTKRSYIHTAYIKYLLRFSEGQRLNKALREVSKVNAMLILTTEYLNNHFRKMLEFPLQVLVYFV